MKDFDVIVIGAGILGIAHAYHCLQAGLKVALIEKNKAPRDATVRNFGQIVPSGMNRKWQKYGRKSLEIYKQIQGISDISVRQQGSVYLAHEKEELGLLEELALINKEENYPSTLLTKEQCLKKYPGLKPSYVIGGLYFPEEVNLDPSIAAKRIIAYCVEQLHLSYFSSKAIKEIEKKQEKTIVTSTDGHSFTAEKVFLCSGNEFQLLYPNLFAESDIKVVKLHMLETKPQPTQRIEGSILTGWSIKRYESFRECPSYSRIIEDSTAFYKQYGIHILFKQSADGSIIIGDSHEYASVTEKDSLAFDLNNEINCFMLSQAQRIFNLEKWEINRSWAGYYCQCEHRDIFNQTIDDTIHIITAIGGKGMTGSFGYAKENITTSLAIN